MSSDATVESSLDYDRTHNILQLVGGHLVACLNDLITMVGVDVGGMGHKILSPEEPDNFTEELQAQDHSKA